MSEKINLNAELREFLSMRVLQILGEDVDNVAKLVLNIKEVGDDIFCLLDDYQVDREWPHVAANMQSMTGIERSTTYKMRDRIRKSNKNVG